MKRWQLVTLILVVIGCIIMAIVSFLLFGNPIGLTALGLLTAAMVLIFPTMPWFVPPLICWIALFGMISMLAIRFFTKKRL